MILSLTDFHNLEGANMNGKQYCYPIFRRPFHQYLKYVFKILIFFKKYKKYASLFKGYFGNV
jgi:hypothetical protein